MRAILDTTETTSTTLSKGRVETPQWARVRADINCGVRRGAWYKVLSLTPEEAVLDVNGRPYPVPRAVLQIVPVRPERWSVVPRPQDAVIMPLHWGSRYAVCPACRHRRSLVAQAAEQLQCPQCGGVFPVAWDDPY